MFKHDILNKITDVGVVAVIRAENSEQAINIAKACIKGGIQAIEITFTVPHAEQVIRDVSHQFKDQGLLVGAGTVLDQATAKLAIDHGATYIVSPGFDLDTAKYCVEQSVPYLPGCLTMTEMLTAKKAGAEIIKLFPGSAFGPSYVKAVKGPLPDINIMPTGGVSLDNVEAWIKSGVVAIGVGSDLTKPAKTGNYEEITTRAKAYVEAVKHARKKVS